MLKNHMIIASVLGIIMSLWHPPIPHFLDKWLTDISKVGSVFPIIVLGAMLDFSKVSFRRLWRNNSAVIMNLPLKSLFSPQSYHVLRFSVLFLY